MNTVDYALWRALQEIKDLQHGELMSMSKLTLTEQQALVLKLSVEAPNKPHKLVHSLADMAEVMNLTKERIRQIRHVMLRKVLKFYIGQNADNGSNR